MCVIMVGLGWWFRCGYVSIVCGLCYIWYVIVLLLILGLIGCVCLVSFNVV